MSKILELYKDILESKQRFVDEVFEAEIYKSAIPQLTIIDLGAYEGEFSFYCYNFAKQIYAFEPDPKPYAILEKRIADYALGDRIKCYPIAMAGKKGKRIFHASGGGGSRLLESSTTDHPNEEKIEVETISLAQFMNENKIEHIDILKVDIEGGEDEVFKADDFVNIVKKIDIIIGEHLGGVDLLLKEYGFKARTVEGSNTIYER